MMSIRLLVLTIAVLSSCLAQAQSPNFVSAIPGKGLYVPATTPNTPGTFIPGGKITLQGKSLDDPKAIGDYCQKCPSCCGKTNQPQLIEMLRLSGHSDVATDKSISQSVDIDVNKLIKH